MRRALLLIGAASATGLLIGGGASRPASSQGTEAAGGLALVAQNYAVTLGGNVRLEFVVIADVPEIAPTTTIARTTTTVATTTTTTATTTPGVPGPPQTTIAQGAEPPTATTPPTTSTTIDPGPEMIVQVRAHRRVTSRDAVDAAIAGSSGPVIDILEFELGDVAELVDFERRVMLDIPITRGPADVDRLDLSEPGLYPVTVRIRRDSELVAAHTTFIELIRPNAIGLGPFSFSVLASIDHPGPAPSDEELDDARRELTALAELAESVDAPVAAAIPPVYIDQVLAGDDALRNRLRSALTAGDTAISLSDNALDPSSAAASDLLGDLAQGFGAGDVALARVFPVAAIERSAWPVLDAITPAGAAAVRDLGAQLLVVPFDTYAGFDGSLPALTDTSLLSSASLPDDSVMRIAVVDPIVALLDPERTATETPATTAIHLMATTSAMRYQLDPDLRSFILTTPDLGLPDPEVLGHVERFVAEHPDYSFVPIADLPDVTQSFFVDGEPVTVELASAPAVSLDERAGRVGGARLRIADVGSMLPEDDGRVAQWDTALRTALSTELDAVDADLRIDAVDNGISAVRDQVLAPETFSFTVTGRSAEIPLRIENTGPTPLSVTVHVEAEKLNVAQPNLAVVLTPNEITNVPVPVSARSNGVFPVFIELRTPAGNPLTEPVELTARVNTLTGLGRVFTVGAMLVLVSWWFSYFRRRKKNERRAARAATRARHPAHTDDAEIELSPDAAEARIHAAHREADDRVDEVGRDEQ